LAFNVRTMDVNIYKVYKIRERRKLETSLSSRLTVVLLLLVLMTNVAMVSFDEYSRYIFQFIRLYLHKSLIAILNPWSWLYGNYERYIHDTNMRTYELLTILNKISLTTKRSLETLFKTRKSTVNVAIKSKTTRLDTYRHRATYL